MDSDFVCVYTHKTLYIVEMLKEVLADNNIESYVMNKQDSSYHFGSIELYVMPQDEARAKEIILEFDKNRI
jgi:hypothetical protein